jgi:hypothetical protein
MRGLRWTVTLAALAGTAALPAAAPAATFPTSFQMLQLTPSRVWQETSFIPDALPSPRDRIYRYRIGSRTFVGPWFPAAASTKTASEALARVHKDATSGFGSGSDGVIVDRPLTAVERRRFTPLADLYRDADVMVVAAGNPACAGLTRAQARSIATGAIRRWSQVAAGAATDTIRVRHLVDGFGNGVPHLGARWVGVNTRQRVNYAPGAVGARDGGVSAAAAGDQAIAAITTWSRVRALGAGPCVVPLNGVAPSDVTVASLRYAEAFPVTYVVTRALVGRSAVARARNAVMRRAMRAHLRSEKVRGPLRGRGALVVGDPVQPAGSASPR